MNNIERAIDYLIKNSHKMIEDNNNYATQSIKIAISALEKQTPSKPQEVDVDFNTFVCPNCLSTIMYTGEKEAHNYCLKCGQKLDWSGEDE
jgi:predicted RNA-binding Zn-ribbon protein involved in translation (DUF1610 family)